jgi:hypothetical protein
MQRRDLSAQIAACAQDLTSRANAAVAAANARIAAVVAAAKSELVVLVPVCQVQANNRALLRTNGHSMRNTTCRMRRSA